jgi:hypothetical protein
VLAGIPTRHLRDNADGFVVQNRITRGTGDGDIRNRAVYSFFLIYARKMMKKLA